MNAGTSSLWRPSVQPPAAATLPFIQPPTFVRFLTFLYWLLSLFFHTSLSPIFHSSLSPFFLHNSCAFSYCLSFLLPVQVSGRNVVNSTVNCSTVCCSLNYYRSILFVLHNCRDFPVAHFGAAILFSACSVAASCCCHFAFCSTTNVFRLSHLSLLDFVTFVFFTIRSPIFHTSLSPIFLHSSCAFSYCLSFLLPVQASGRNVANSIIHCSTVFCSLN